MYLYNWFICENVFIRVALLCGQCKVGDFKEGYINLLSFVWV